MRSLRPCRLTGAVPAPASCNMPQEHAGAGTHATPCPWAHRPKHPRTLQIFGRSLLPPPPPPAPDNACAGCPGGPCRRTTTLATGACQVRACVRACGDPLPRGCAWLYGCVHSVLRGNNGTIAFLPHHRAAWAPPGPPPKFLGPRRLVVEAARSLTPPPPAISPCLPSNKRPHLHLHLHLHLQARST